jgi:hypothetical protein
MASSAVSAIIDRYNSLTGVPTLYSFDAPVSADGAQVYPSYTVLLDNGTDTGYELELTVLEVTSITLMVYANTLLEVDAAVEAIKYNGGGVSDGLGLDFGALPTLDIGYYNLEVRRVREKRFAAGVTGRSAQRIHGCELDYRVSLYRSS